ncbi:MAG TPA: YncE family protein [Gemmatimonadaceae bacterium]|nr:YncE family protein [Gemmatimonadaceae bacterium]
MSIAIDSSLERRARRFASARHARACLSALVVALACANPAARPSPSVVPQGAVATAAQSPPTQDYIALVASESVDQIAFVRFGPSGIRVDRTNTTGVMPADVDGPHGVSVSPDGKFYYVSTAHGTPYGYLWKYSTANDSLAGRVMLGNFPATVQLTPDGEFAYVVNFNLHGEMVPSSVSIVATGEMIEVARVTTCTMPHGSRINVQGTKQYSACMMDDMAVEIDTRGLGVSRYFMLTKGKEMGMEGAPAQRGAPNGSHDMGGHGMEPPKPGDVSCSPTWVQPSADGGRIYVACNKSSDIVEIDVARWAMTRRIPAGDGVYNLAVTRNGKLLVATNKRGKSVSVIDLATGAESARIPTTRRVVHGVAISTDDRFAFVSQEGIGSEPGAVDVIDLQALKKVATIDVGQQAGGIDFLRVAPSH